MRYNLILLSLLCLVLARATASGQELQQLIDQGKFSAAASHGETLLVDHPGLTQTTFLTAYAHQNSGQEDRAIELYEKLIADNPDLPEPRNNLAMIYLSRGDYDASSQLLVEAINTHPSYATAYENLNRIYKGIASEAYRRAVNESSEPAKYAHNIELAAITRLDSPDTNLVDTLPEEEPSLIETANQETLLIEQVKNWASAWSDKNFADYTEFYAQDYRGSFPSHSAWIDYRRKRIVRSEEISVEVDNIQIKWLSDARAIVDFKQAFDSPGFSDRVSKRLVFSRFGSQWKITQEQVLSVL